MKKNSLIAVLIFGMMLSSNPIQAISLMDYFKSFFSSASSSMPTNLPNIAALIPSLSYNQRIALAAFIFGTIGLGFIYNKYGKPEKIVPKEEADKIKKEKAQPSLREEQVDLELEKLVKQEIDAQSRTDLPNQINNNPDAFKIPDLPKSPQIIQEPNQKKLEPQVQPKEEFLSARLTDEPGVLEPRQLPFVPFLQDEQKEEKPEATLPTNISVKKQVKIDLSNSSRDTVFKYSINTDDCSAGASIQPLKQLPISVAALLTYIDNKISTIEFNKTNIGGQKVDEVRSIALCAGSQEKIITEQDLDLFAAIIRKRLPTLEIFNSSSNLSIQLQLRFDSIITTHLAISGSGLILPNFDAHIAYLNKQISNGIILPVRLHNGYSSNVIYTTESAERGLKHIGSCDANANKLLKKDDTDFTFGTIWLKKESEKPEITDIQFNQFAKNSLMKAFCVKSTGLAAQYTSLVYRFSSWRTQLKDLKLDPTTINPQTDYLEIQLKPNQYSELNPLARYEATLNANIGDQEYSIEK